MNSIRRHECGGISRRLINSRKIHFCHRKVRARSYLVLAIQHDVDNVALFVALHGALLLLPLSA